LGITIHDEKELLAMSAACKLAKNVLINIAPYVVEGTSTAEIDETCNKYMIDNGAVSATLNYRGFPKSICVSVNHVICHGIPGEYKLKNGDIVNIDVTVKLDGWHGDTSKTFLVGNCSNLAESLVKTAAKALEIGIDAVRPFGYFGDIGAAIQKFVSNTGFSIVHDYCGHGIGKVFHSEPTVLHYDNHEKGDQILPGMFFTIEPMINVGSRKSKILNDGWTVVTVDKSLSAQFEHTIAVTEDSVKVLTM
jgi:methionyl aminopeptidase